MKFSASAAKRLLIPGGVVVLGLLIIVSLFIWSYDPRNIPDSNAVNSGSSGPVSSTDDPDVADSAGPMSSVNGYRDSSHQKTVPDTLANKGVSEAGAELNSKPDSGSPDINLSGAPAKEARSEAGGPHIKSDAEVHVKSENDPGSKSPGKSRKGPSVTRSADGSYIINLAGMPAKESPRESPRESHSEAGAPGVQSTPGSNAGLRNKYSSKSGDGGKYESITARVPNNPLTKAAGTVGRAFSTVSPVRASESEEESPDIIPFDNNSGLQQPALQLEPISIKTFRFTWADISGETEYRLLEKIHGSSGYKQVAKLPADAGSHDLKVFLPLRVNAYYILQACNGQGCASSAPIKIGGTLTEAVGYLKASNTGSEDRFGHSVAISGDGNTLAVGAPWEDGAGAGIGPNGEQNNDSASASGAVYVFIRNGAAWTQQAYVKSSNTRAGEEFGWSVSLSDDGNTLAVGAEHGNSEDVVKSNRKGKPGAAYIFVRSGGAWTQQAAVKASGTGTNGKASDSFGVSVALSGNGNTLAVGAYGDDSSATGINGAQNNDQAVNSGAVYVFTRGGRNWTQQAYVKASNTEAGDHFGRSVSLSNDGNTLAVGANMEDSAATGINGDQDDNTAISGGAVYVFVRSGGNWAQQAYVKASNTRPGDLLTADEFGWSVALSGDGNTLAVGARFEDSTATGVNGNEYARSKHSSGAVYTFVRSGGSWMQQAYIKASNTGWGDEFGASVALSANGNALAVGAYGEDSNATGINGEQNNNTLMSPGAAYVFSRSRGNWSQRAYVKACNTGLVPRDPEHAFGFSVALSDGGDTLAVGAPQEDSAVTGASNCQNDSFAGGSGAVYLY